MSAEAGMLKVTRFPQEIEAILQRMEGQEQTTEDVCELRRYLQDTLARLWVYELEADEDAASTLLGSL